MKIIVSMGDPNGIGLEVFAKGIQLFDKKNKKKPNHEICLCGNIKTISEYYSHFNNHYKIKGSSIKIGKRICSIIECDNYSPVNFGKETESAGKLASGSIEIAVNKTINNEFDALLTLPVSKSALYLSGWKYPGHTEMLAAKCKIENPLMILSSKQLRVGLATIHIPLNDVSKTISIYGLVDTIIKFNNSLRHDFSIDKPKIAVLGLNPHAGENGALGNEEINTIIPAINKLKPLGIKISPPLPADGFFAHGDYKNFDGILAMYHDQGLIPLKLIAKGAGVNFTAGLPFIRTSPDHGTAFSLAGKNKADGKSVYFALKQSVQIYKARSKKLK